MAVLLKSIITPGDTGTLKIINMIPNSPDITLTNNLNFDGAEGDISLLISSWFPKLKTVIKMQAFTKNCIIICTLHSTQIQSIIKIKYILRS